MLFLSSPYRLLYINILLLIVFVNLSNRERSVSINQVRQSNIALRHNLTQSRIKSIMIETKVGRTTTEACIDTGATISSISDFFLNVLKRNNEKIMEAKGYQYKLYGADGRLIKQPSKPVRLTIEIQNKSITNDFHVLKGGEDMLVGFDILKKTNCTIKFREDKAEVQFRNAEKETDNYARFPREDTTIQSGLSLVEAVTEIFPSKRGEAINIQNTKLIAPFETVEIFDQIVNHTSSGKMLLQVYNSGPPIKLLRQLAIIPFQKIDEKDIIISKDQSERNNKKIQSSQKIRLVSDGPPILSEEEIENLEPPSYSIQIKDPNQWRIDYFNKVDTPGSDLKEKLFEFLISEVENVIAKHEYDIGSLSPEYNVKFHLTPQTDDPLQQAPYRLNEVRLSQLEATLDKMIKANIFKPGYSPHSNPVFLVRKQPSQTLRLTIDLRKLNRICNKTRTLSPLPNQQDLFNSLQGFHLYSLIDLQAAYTSVHCTEETAKLTSVITPTRQLWSLRMLFGSAEAPNLFSHLMTLITKDVPHIDSTPVALAYLDDIIIRTKATSKEFPDKDPSELHFHAIKSVLKVLHKAGLKVNISKMVIAKRSIVFLGKEIDADGWRATPKHIQGIQDLTEPSDRNTLQQYLGFINFHHQLIPEYSRIVEPFTNLLKKDVPWEWTEECKERFLKIKEMINRQCKTYFIDYKRDLYLFTDSSERFIASCLFQIKTYSKEKLARYLKEYGGPLHSLPPDEEEDLDEVYVPKRGKGAPTAFNMQGKNVEIKPLSEDKVHIILPVAYCSRKFGPSELNYSIYEKEILASVFACKHFENLLIPARKVYLYSDSTAYLWSVKNCLGQNHRVSRWLCLLSSLPIEIICMHCTSKQNISDFLTRPSILKVEKINDLRKAVVVRTPFTPGQVITFEQLFDAVRADPDCVVPAQDSDCAQSDPLEPGAHGAEDVNDPYRVLSRVTRTDSVEADPLSACKIERLRENLQGPVLQSRQMTDPFCIQVTKGETKHKTRDVSTRMGILHIRGLPVLPAVLEGVAVALFHQESHSGIRVVHETLRQQFFTSLTREKIADFVRGCYFCQVCKPPLAHIPYLHVPLPAFKNSTWGIDLVEGLPEYRGFKTYLTAVEYYSSFKILIPLNNTTAKRIAKEIENHILSVFPGIHTLYSDGGSNLLASKEVKLLCQWYGVQPRVGLPMASWSRGRVEIANRYSQELLAIFMLQFKFPWVNLLKYVQRALNNRPIKCMEGKTPNFLLFGAQGRENITVSPSSYNIEKEIKDANTFWEENGKLCQKLIDKYDAHMNKVLENKGGKFFSLEQNSFIFLRDLRPIRKPQRKSKYFRTPLRVLKDLGQGVMAEDFYGTVKIYHKTFVKQLHVPEGRAFQELPLDVQSVLGPEFTIEDLNKFMDNKQIPSFYLDPLPQNRAPRRDRPAPENDDTGDNVHDDDDRDNDGMVLRSDPPKRVTFQAS